MASLKYNLAELQRIQKIIEEKALISEEWGYWSGYESGEKHVALYNCQKRFIDDGELMTKKQKPFIDYEAFRQSVGENDLLPFVGYSSMYGTPFKFYANNPSEFYVSLYLRGAAAFSVPGSSQPGTNYYYKAVKIPPHEKYYGQFIAPGVDAIYWDVDIIGIFYSCIPEDQKVIKVTYKQNGWNNNTLTYFCDRVSNADAPVPADWIPSNRYFKGWNTYSDGTGVWLRNSSMVNIPADTDELTVYAIWGYQYTVTYRMEENSTVKVTRTYTSDSSSVNITLPTPESLGFTTTAAGAKSFIGWGHRPMGNVSIVQPGTTFKLTNNKEFFGQWYY